MTDRDLNTYTAADLADPAFDQATLAQLAGSRPDLWQTIIAHPNCYPDLANWIRPQLPASAAQPVSQPAVQPVAQPAVQPVAQPAVQPAVQPVADPAANPWAAQNTGAMPQMNTGALPTMSSGPLPQMNNPQAGFAPQQGFAPQGFPAQAQGPTAVANNDWMKWAPIAVPGLAFIMILTLFLPIGSIYDVSENYFSPGNKGEGTALLIIFVLALAAGVTALLTREHWSRFVSGALGVLAGLFGVISAFTSMVGVSGQYGASIGVGLIILLILSLVMLGAGVVMLLPAQQQYFKAARPAQPYVQGQQFGAQQAQAPQQFGAPQQQFGGQQAQAQAQAPQQYAAPQQQFGGQQAQAQAQAPQQFAAPQQQFGGQPAQAAQGFGAGQQQYGAPQQQFAAAEQPQQPQQPESAQPEAQQFAAPQEQPQAAQPQAAETQTPPAAEAPDTK